MKNSATSEILTNRQEIYGEMAKKIPKAAAFAADAEIKNAILTEGIPSAGSLAKIPVKEALK